MNRVIFAVFSLLASVNLLGYFMGAISGTSNNLGLLMLGSSLMCVHAAINPAYVRNPFAHRDVLLRGRGALFAKLGLVVLAIGLVEVSGLELAPLPHEAAKMS